MVGIAGALLVASFSLLAPEEVSDRQVARDAVAPSPSTPHTANGTGRIHYPYSVVPGGLHSTQELETALKDPVVAAHYAAVNVSAVRVDRVRAPRRVYVSYRAGDKVYWTKRMLTLSPGERILTDGRTEIRSRCGNRIADAPQEPTSADEPLITEFDRAIAPFPDGDLPDGHDERSPAFGSVPLLPDPLTTFTGANPGDEVSFGGPASRLTPANMAIGGLEPDGSSSGEAPSRRGPSTAGVDILDIDAPLASPQQPSLVDPGALPQPVPVPEPGSLLLVGTGLAGGAWRAWRRRRLKGTPPR